MALFAQWTEKHSGMLVQAWRLSEMLLFEIFPSEAFRVKLYKNFIYFIKLAFIRFL